MATRPTEAAGTQSARDPADSPAPPPPRALRLAAAAQAAEAVGMCVAAAFAAVSTADGQSYQLASGVALTLIAVGTAAVFAAFAVGLAKARPWTRTPVVMTQLFVGRGGYLPAERAPARLGRAHAAARGLLPGRPVHPG